MTASADRPLFVDPIALAEGDAVDDAPAPGWFWFVALVLLVAAVYYAFTFWSGPRTSYRHDFEHGRATTEQVP